MARQQRSTTFTPESTRPITQVALYARVSTLNNQDPEMQLSELREYAGRRGWQIVEEFTDQEHKLRLIRRCDGHNTCQSLDERNGDVTPTDRTPPDLPGTGPTPSRAMMVMTLRVHFVCDGNYFARRLAEIRSI
jgi:hypothetical protein